MAGMTIKGLVHYTPKESFELCEKDAILVDVREEYAVNYKAFDIPSLINKPFSDFYQGTDDLPKNKLLIIADATGMKSKEICLYLKGKDYENVANMAGGILEWERDGFPVKVHKDNNFVKQAFENKFARKNARKNQK